MNAADCPANLPLRHAADGAWIAPAAIRSSAARLAWIDAVATALDAADKAGKDGERVTALLLLALDLLRTPDAASGATRTAYSVAPPSLRGVTLRASNAADVWRETLAPPIR